MSAVAGIADANIVKGEAHVSSMFKRPAAAERLKWSPKRVILQTYTACPCYEKLKGLLLDCSQAIDAPRMLVLVSKLCSEIDKT